MQGTTDLNQLKNNSTIEFTWGKILKFHEIGPYTIGEYLEWKIKNNHIYIGEVSDTVAFHIWVDRRDTRRVCSTLEEALATAITYRFEGPNSQAAAYHS